MPDLESNNLPVMEHFYTIQGEGAHSGRPAYFIRLAGCDVGCPWCDVKESWDKEKHPEISISTLVESAASFPIGIAVITGGEPLLHNLESLTKSLRQKGFQTHIETSGSSPFSGHFDWITFSPKRYKAPLDEIYEKTSELKVIIAGKQDFRWAERHAGKCGKGTRLFLQPEWETPESVQWIIDYVKKHPQWQISLQTHKYLQVP